MIRADLHLHTNVSDGVLSPENMVHECRMERLDVMAITDHDTFCGSDAALSLPHAPEILPGIELSLGDMPGLHLLGYGHTGPCVLRDRVRELTQLREERARSICRRLAEMGMELNFRELERKRHQCHAGATIGRPHIARAMVQARYVRNMHEAFEKYLGNGRPAYVACQRMNMEEALRVLHDSGFIAVLAHPLELNLEDQLLYSLVKKWKNMGLDGVEVYHPSAASGGYATLDRMARDLTLLVTGGSDFHQEHNPAQTRIGSTLPAWRRGEEDLEKLRERIRSV